jgi:hypothetical protein
MVFNMLDIPYIIILSEYGWESQFCGVCSFAAHTTKF